MVPGFSAIAPVNVTVPLEMTTPSGLVTVLLFVIALNAEVPELEKEMWAPALFTSGRAPMTVPVPWTLTVPVLSRPVAPGLSVPPETVSVPPRLTVTDVVTVAAPPLATVRVPPDWTVTVVLAVSVPLLTVSVPLLVSAAESVTGPWTLIPGPDVLLLPSVLSAEVAELEKSIVPLPLFVTGLGPISAPNVPEIVTVPLFERPVAPGLSVPPLRASVPVLVTNVVAVTVPPLTVSVPPFVIVEALNVPDETVRLAPLAMVIVATDPPEAAVISG
jgi:hypothetical protein